MQRFPCQVLDSNWLIQNPLEVNTVFLPTRMVTYQQSAPRCGAGGTHTSSITGALVSDTTETECTYALSTAKTTVWVPDVEGYTLRIDHAIAAPGLSLAWSKDQMEQGKILDTSGNAVDPCAYYAARNPRAPCPLNALPNPNATNYISVGARGVPDIIALGTLLQAAGVPSLDLNGVPSTETMRYGGLTLVVQLTYDNFFSADYTRARYSYNVQAIPGKVKGVFSAGMVGNVPDPDRFTFEKSGIRVVLTFAGA